MSKLSMERDVLTGNKILELQIMEPQSLALYIEIVLSCPFISSRSSSTANQRVAQNNYQGLGCQDLYFLNLVTCTGSSAQCLVV